MKKVILTRGLPGSGKSTWAKEMISNNHNSYKRVNKDDLRSMIDNNFTSKSTEKLILDIRDSIIMLCIENGKNVIVDDTNLSETHYNRISQLVKGKAEVIIKDFTNVPLETCIERDSKRTNPVGSKVIKEMYKQSILEVEEYVEDDNLPKAILVDIDGTLAKMKNRSPFDWHKVGEDECKVVVKNIVNSYNGKVIVFSGRDSVCMSETSDWLKSNNIKHDGLFMREEGNQEKDSIIKRRLFEQHIRGKYFVEYVLDDRQQVVDMWRNMGLTCLQVAEGDF